MKTYPKTHLQTAIGLAVCFLIAITALPERQTSRAEAVPISLSIEPDVEPENIEALDPEPTAPKENWNEVTIRSGDSLSTIFTRAGLSARELHDVISIGPDVAVLNKIKPGKMLQLDIGSDGKLNALRYDESPLKRLMVRKENGEFSAFWDFVNPEVLLSYKTARITEKDPSLYQAGKSAGLTDNLIMELSYIFQWDISFALDLRQGDSFTVLYEDVYVEGEKVTDGEILAARFENFGKTYEAVLYEDENGRKSYFTPEGGSLRKAFLRDPVHFSHVSSSFNLKRLHPIHNKVMPHRGIDYAANRGTPVVASGDGKVTIARQNNASGRYVVIQHGEQYTTKYLHLSAFAKDIRPGKSVRQGQTIGYVGASGWATAPHLHYEFLVNGVHRNPRTVELPKASPVAKKDMPRFLAFTQPALAKLNAVNRGYALAEEAKSTNNL